jgi:hypothetical protein
LPGSGRPSSLADSGFIFINFATSCPAGKRSRLPRIRLRCASDTIGSLTTVDGSFNRGIASFVSINRAGFRGLVGAPGTGKNRHHSISKSAGSGRPPRRSGEQRYAAVGVELVERVAASDHAVSEPKGRHRVLDRHHRTIRIDRLVEVDLWLWWRALEDLRDQLGAYNDLVEVVDDHPLEMPAGQPLRLGQGLGQPGVQASVVELQEEQVQLRKNQVLVVAGVAEQGRAVIQRGRSSTPSVVRMMRICLPSDS